MKVIVRNSKSILLINLIQLIYLIRHIISKNKSSRKRMQYEYQIIAAEEDIYTISGNYISSSSPSIFLYIDKAHLFYVLLQPDINNTSRKWINSFFDETILFEYLSL